MLKLKKRATVSDGCLSNRQCIGILCIFQMLITYLSCFFWFVMILDAHKKKTMETWDVVLMYSMLALSVATVISASIGFIGVLTENFDVCLMFLKSDIVHCVYFGVTTIGLIILSIFILINGENKMNNYRWTKLINMYNGKYAKYILPISVSATIFFWLMTLLSVMCHGKIRRLTKRSKKSFHENERQDIEDCPQIALSQSDQQNEEIVDEVDDVEMQIVVSDYPCDDPSNLKPDEAEANKEESYEESESNDVIVKAKLWSSSKLLLPPESEEPGLPGQEVPQYDSGILLPSKSQEMRHDEMKKLAQDMKKHPIMTQNTDPRSIRWMELARKHNGC